jgi:hypothetical protein
MVDGGKIRRPDGFSIRSATPAGALGTHIRTQMRVAEHALAARRVAKSDAAGTFRGAQRPRYTCSFLWKTFTQP